MRAPARDTKTYLNKLFKKLGRLALNNSIIGIWEDRATFLKKLQAQGRGWDGYDAAAPNNASVTHALEIMGFLEGVVEKPSKLMIDEDGDVVLTWGKAGTGIMVFLTVDPDALYLHVMDGEKSVLSTEEHLGSSQCGPQVVRDIQSYIKRID